MKLSTPAAFVVLGLLSLVVLVLTVDGPIKRSVISDDGSKIAVRVLLKRLESFPDWSSAVKLSGPDVVDKDVLTKAAVRFHTERTSQEAIEYYTALALAQGWMPREAGDAREKRFCKDGISFMIRTSRLDRGVDYTISLAWTEQVRSPSYCAQSQAGE